MDSHQAIQYVTSLLELRLRSLEVVDHSNGNGDVGHSIECVQYRAKRLTSS